MNTLLPIVCLVICSGKLGSCWFMFSEMKDHPKESYEANFTSATYYYGKCSASGIKLLAHIYKQSFEMLGKIIVRGWLDIKRIPTCIVVRMMSIDKDMMRSTATNAQICVPRITYCHSHKRYKYFYYEIHLSYFFKGGQNWDIYFYGYRTLVW